MKLGDLIANRDVPISKRFKYESIRCAVDRLSGDCWQTVLCDSAYEVQKLRAAFARFAKKYEFKVANGTFYIRKRLNNPTAR